MIIDGKKISEEIIAGLKEERLKIKKEIRLAVVLVGDHPANLSFIKQKEKTAQKLDIGFRLYQYPITIKTKELRKKVGEISRVTYNRGVVVQLPLPNHLNSQAVLNAILPQKDPDVLTERNLGSFYVNRLDILPPVVFAIDYLLRKYEIETRGKNVLIIGRGVLVGKPSAVYFLNQGATVIVANSQTQNLNNLIENADIIVSGAGQPNLIKGDIIKEGVIIFDASVVSENGQLKGDCDLESVKNKAKLVTPVPHGLGPISVVMLFKNLITLIKKQK